VLLTLRLAPEAYIAIGFVFAVLLLVALGMTVAARSSTLDDTAGRLSTPTGLNARKVK
jgi:hypothetical protein